VQRRVLIGAICIGATQQFVVLHESAAARLDLAHLDQAGANMEGKQEVARGVNYSTTGSS
jgi:hypothetical protein